MTRRDARADALRLRDRTDSDWPALLSVWVAAWRVTFPEIDFDARRDWLVNQIITLEAKGARTLCLFTTAIDPASADLVGFVTINPATGWLDQICVGPAYFGQGFAEELLAVAKEISPQQIRLDVNADNQRARAFYARNGFATIGAGASALSGRATILMEWRATR